jgi:hypothetical protein
MDNIGAGFVDGLREAGHAVADELGISGCRCGDLVERAARFVDAALTVEGRVGSGRAYIRLSCSRGLLFVEVTALGAGTFDALMNNDAARVALEELRACARDSGQATTTERGPRDQFRITVVLQPGNGADFSSGCAVRPAQRHSADRPISGYPTRKARPTSGAGEQCRNHRGGEVEAIPS